MLKTAKKITDDYEGIFPKDIKTLWKLPGVWPYTARALLAFGYGEPYLAWDTNLEKVFARYYTGSRTCKLTDREKEEIEKDFREYLEKTINEEWKQAKNIRAVNNALMDFASLVDLKNPTHINWGDYPLQSGKFYETRWTLEIVETKKTESFPIPDATIIVILHKDHKIYYSSGEQLSSYLRNDLQFTDSDYSPFLLAPALHRDTRKYVQDYFREKYSLELSVRPVHKKWLSQDEKPYIAVNAQIQVGQPEFEIYEKKSDIFVKLSQIA